MKTMRISRYTTDTELGTLSHVSFPQLNNEAFHYLEPPWIENQPFISCIPPGAYAGILMPSRKFPKDSPVYFLVGGTVVRNKADMAVGRATRYACIAGHSANWHQQLQGCGAFGMTSRRNHAGKPGLNQRSHYVGSSRNALRAVKDVLQEAPVIQVIIGWDL